MEEKLLDIEYRKKIIKEIKSDENVQRKIKSYKKQNMQDDNFYQYVKEELEKRLDAATVKEMNIFASVNLQRRISKAEASVYLRRPERKFFFGKKETEDLKEVYEHLGLDSILRSANEKYKYQGQCTGQIYPKDGYLKARVLLPHHFDVIQDESDREHAMAYIISNFDNTSRDKILRENNEAGFSQGNTYRDNINQSIADYDDQKLSNERYTVWSKKYNFVMNGKGEFLDKDTDQVLVSITENDPNIVSPLAEFEIIPFFDISAEKSFEYWVRGYDSLYDATIIYNTILTSEFQTVELQGHAQAYYKGDANHMPEALRVGPDKVIFLPVDANNQVNSEFGFANTGADLGGIRQFRESFLAAFLTSRGLDTSIVSGEPTTDKASSGTEKLLQMIEKFEASQEDFAKFEKAEQEILLIVCAYIKAFNNNELDDSFRVSLPNDLEEIKVVVKFSGPEMVKTETETLDIKQKELEMGLTSRVHILMEMKGMTKDQAVEYLNEVDQFEGMNGNNQQTNLYKERSFTEIQP